MASAPPGYVGRVLADEPMSRHTSLRVGGPADAYYEPESRESLVALLEHLERERVPVTVVGGGYNLLVRDGGIRGAAVTLKALCGFAFDGRTVTVGSGCATRMLVEEAAARDLGGIEFLAHIPGTVGGALAMNAGAHGAEILDFVTTLALFRDGALTSVPASSLDRGYRYLSLPAGSVIVSAEIVLEPAPREKVRERVAALGEARSGQKVGYPSAGSFFRNPPGLSAWQLIDRAGLRGARVGGAMVSDIHTNFLVNTGGATAADFLELAALVKRRVKETAGIELEEEVRIVGEDA